MKRILVLAVGLSTSVIVAQGQITKGTKLLGGSIKYENFNSSQKSNNPLLPTTNQWSKTEGWIFNISPRAGAFVADNLAVGVALGVGANKAKYLQEYGQNTGYEQINKSASYSIAPFLRYYYLPVETFGVYGNLEAGYVYQPFTTDTSRPSISSSKGRMHSKYVNLTPALVFFPIPQLGLELSFGSIGYNHNKQEAEEEGQNMYTADTKNSGFGAYFGFENFSFGASYYLGR